MFKIKNNTSWGCFILLSASLMSFTSGLYSLSSGLSYVLEYMFMKTSGLEFIFVLYSDFISLLFFSVVTLIAGSVVFYSESYMHGDSGEDRFTMLVILFVASMFFMVFSLNIISIMLGWDGLGVISYILVVYYQSDKASAAGMITALSNRIGDAALLLSVGGMIEGGSWNFMFFSGSSGLMEGWIMISIVLAGMTKSAQIPFSAWLPAAMAAPTPVSALVHSSTLVTAGVYLLIRFSPLLIKEGLMTGLMFIGMMTTLLASMSAMNETDLKKIVALSTLSQLGIMMSTLGFGAVQLAYFHMLIHAVFKALLFMCSGKIIHMMEGSQDLRSGGGKFMSLPFTSASLNLSNLALMGMPFLAGFYSKDSLLESFLMEDTSSSSYIMYFMMVGLSASYSYRFSYLSVISSESQKVSSSSEEEDSVMMVSKLGLMLTSLSLGAMLMWVIFSTGQSIFLPLHFKLYGVASAFLGFLMGFLLVLMEMKGSKMKTHLGITSGFMVMCNLPLISGAKLGVKAMKLSGSLKKLDLGWWEKSGGKGTGNLLLSSGNIMFESQYSFFKKILMVLSLGLVIWVSF